MPVNIDTLGIQYGCRAVNTLETKVDKNKPPPSKRTHSDVSNESNNSLDLSGIMNFQKDIDEIKIKLEGVTRREDLDRVTKDLIKTSDLEQVADIRSNYNEQYSRKNNIKIINFPRKDKQDLRKDFMETVKKEPKVQLEDRDVVAIHRIPSQKAGPYPVIVKLFSSDVKRQIMRCRKELTSKIRFVDDVTQRNMSLIVRLRKTDEFESVWYLNCGIYGRTPAGLQLKIGLYDDIHYRLQHGK
ncbi:unnamed protein product [Mytilus edulis]|uniref:Uncharacterized protein n=1 Tax=Mytilus edulis TaxID=6550 RepID=A0A8S3VI83_MYTED|nr:unnamed protein product [Mytilus edulis]